MDANAVPCSVMHVPSTLLSLSLAFSVICMYIQCGSPTASHSRPTTLHDVVGSFTAAVCFV